jgi:hypothetical protein
VLAAITTTTGFDTPTTSLEIHGEGQLRRVELPGLYTWPAPAETPAASPAQ